MKHTQAEINNAIEWADDNRINRSHNKMQPSVKLCETILEALEQYKLSKLIKPITYEDIQRYWQPFETCPILKQVLVCFENGNILVMEFTSTIKKMTLEGMFPSTPTHWQPLPKTQEDK